MVVVHPFPAYLTSVVVAAQQQCRIMVCNVQRILYASLSHKS